MSLHRQFLSRSVRLDGVIDVIILLALSGSWVGLLGSSHWLPDLFSHFRWQYLVVSLLAVGWCFRRRRRAIAWISFFTLTLNVWLIGALAISSRPFAIELATDFRLRVVSLNVLTSNQRYQDVLDYLHSDDADLIFLMEIDSIWAAKLESLKLSHPHHLVHPRADNFGIALFSRLPLQQLRIIREFGQSPATGAYSTPSIEAHLSMGSRELVLYGIHPVPPAGFTAWQSRNHQLRAVADCTAETGKPTIVIGDLNATPWCEGMRSLRSNGRLDFRSAIPPWLPTWRARSIFAIPIDHVLCTSPLVIKDRKVGPDLGSDHRPQLFEVGWVNQ